LFSTRPHFDEMGWGSKRRYAFPAGLAMLEKTHTFILKSRESSDYRFPPRSDLLGSHYQGIQEVIPRVRTSVLLDVVHVMNRGNDRIRNKLVAVLGKEITIVPVVNGGNDGLQSKLVIVLGKEIAVAPSGKAVRRVLHAVEASNDE